MEEPSQEQRKLVKTYTTPLPYPQKLQKEIKDQQFPKFLEVFKKLEINIPLAEALEQMPLYAKFLKELINKKKSWNEKETVIPTQECSVVIQEGLPPKLKDPGSFYLPCDLGSIIIDKALCDLGSNINLMPMCMMRSLCIEEVKPTQMRKGNDSLKLGRLFLATARAIIDVEKEEMTLRVNDEKIIINVFKAMQYPLEKEKHMRVEIIEEVEEELLEDNNQEEQEVEIEVEQGFIEEEVVEISFESKADEKPKQ
ncbi:uncharacterized protein LOC130980859 [Arachis stenosperma]|uniref:uncharacterized protein LOC130980859 n=1 Tax=Arachis stenosperma TaxID=217475 RepID=UPI0025AD7F78|nr:uncharacterized protein LOC130980859 [Arachis stenosperma]